MIGWIVLSLVGQQKESASPRAVWPKVRLLGRPAGGGSLPGRCVARGRCPRPTHGRGLSSVFRRKVTTFFPNCKITLALPHLPDDEPKWQELNEIKRTVPSRLFEIADESGQSGQTFLWNCEGRQAQPTGQSRLATPSTNEPEYA